MKRKDLRAYSVLIYGSLTKHWEFLVLVSCFCTLDNIGKFVRSKLSKAGNRALEIASPHPRNRLRSTDAFKCKLKEICLDSSLNSSFIIVPNTHLILTSYCKYVYVMLSCLCNSHLNHVDRRRNVNACNYLY